MSQIVYEMSMPSSPKSVYFEEVKQYLFKFIWKFSKDRIARPVLQTCIEEQVLPDIDLEYFVNCNWTLANLPKKIINYKFWVEHILLILMIVK